MGKRRTISVTTPPGYLVLKASLSPPAYKKVPSEDSWMKRTRDAAALNHHPSHQYHQCHCCEGGVLTAVRVDPRRGDDLGGNVEGPLEDTDNEQRTKGRLVREGIEGKEARTYDERLGGACGEETDEDIEGGLQESWDRANGG